MSSLATVSFLLMFFLGLVVSADSVACYWPNQSNASESGTILFPCTSFADANGDSQCCWQNDFCTSSGFCMSTMNAVFYRGACTKRDWNTNACPNQCFNETWAGNSIAVSPCDNDNFACGYAGGAGMAGDVCGNGGDTFKVSGTGKALQYQVMNTTSTFAPVEIFPASAANVANTTFSNTSAVNSSTTLLTTVTARSHSTEIALGAGLGVPLALSLIAVAALSVMLLRTQKVSQGQERQESATWPIYQPPHELFVNGHNPGTPTAEMSVQKEPSELQSKPSLPVELDRTS